MACRGAAQSPEDGSPRRDPTPAPRARDRSGGDRGRRTARSCARTRAPVDGTGRARRAVSHGRDPALPRRRIRCRPRVRARHSRGHGALAAQDRPRSAPRRPRRVVAALAPCTDPVRPDARQRSPAREGQDQPRVRRGVAAARRRRRVARDARSRRLRWSCRASVGDDPDADARPARHRCGCAGSRSEPGPGPRARRNRIDAWRARRRARDQLVERRRGRGRRADVHRRHRRRHDPQSRRWSVRARTSGTRRVHAHSRGGAGVLAVRARVSTFERARRAREGPRGARHHRIPVSRARLSRARGRCRWRTRRRRARRAARHASGRADDRSTSPSDRVDVGRRRHGTVFHASRRDAVVGGDARHAARLGAARRQRRDHQAARDPDRRSAGPRRHDHGSRRRSDRPSRRGRARQCRADSRSDRAACIVVRDDRRRRIVRARSSRSRHISRRR